MSFFIICHLGISLFLISFWQYNIKGQFFTLTFIISQTDRDKSYGPKTQNSNNFIYLYSNLKIKISQKL